MQLTLFISTLLKDGKVTVEGNLHAFEEEDLQNAATILKQYHYEDSLEMPYTAPAFSEEAALWAARFFYLSVQLTVLREIDEATIKDQLKNFTGAVTAETIYSVDLMFRYLPALLNLAKGLAPADILVQELYNIVTIWPFSSQGIELETAVNYEAIFTHPSLKHAFIDRIIKHQDLGKALNNPVREAVEEALGNYAAVLWPEFEHAIK